MIARPTMPPWDSDDYDRQIRAERTAARKAVQLPTRRRLNRTIEVNPGKPCGDATDADLLRRRRAERQIKEEN